MKFITHVLSTYGRLLILLIGAISQTTFAASDQNFDALVSNCIACHGEKGVSTIATQPNLAGQKQAYLAQELTKFRDGQRINPLMDAVVKNLSDSQIDALASYFAKQTNPKLASTTQNTAGQHVRARCISCHGMQGFTVNKLWPNLAGQQKIYLAKQLRDFKSGQRNSPTMSVIANELTNQQIADVAEYFSQQKASR